MKNTSKQQQDNRQSSINAIISEQRTFSGPLPHPEDLAKYDQIVPGAADRIIKMAENEMRHRHRNEDKLTNGMIWTTVLSMIFAFFIAAALAGLSFFLAYRGYYAASASVAVGSIAAVVSAFLLKSKSKDRKENQQE